MNASVASTPPSDRLDDVLKIYIPNLADFELETICNLIETLAKRRMLEPEHASTELHRQKNLQ